MSLEDKLLKRFAIEKQVKNKAKINLTLGGNK
jgi:hypothetical protein